MEKIRTEKKKRRFKKRLAYQVLTLILRWYQSNSHRPVPAQRYFQGTPLRNEFENVKSRCRMQQFLGADLFFSPYLVKNLLQSYIE